jgi:uncharacterized protein YjbI with pentapeptide repeats
MTRKQYQGEQLILHQFSYAELACANFQDAILFACDFKGAFLHQANFANATLITCDFTGAALVGADLRVRSLRNCVFINANLEGVIWPPDPIEGIGNLDCLYNARSPLLRCAIHPLGDCEECSHFERSRLSS